MARFFFLIGYDSRLPIQNPSYLIVDFPDSTTIRHFKIDQCPPSIILMQARSQPSRWGGSELGWAEHYIQGMQARIRDFLKGGRVKTFTSTPPPLDIARVTSSNWKTPPLLDIHKHTHPWTLSVWRHPHSKGEGWSVPVTHTLHRFSVLGQVQGGGGCSSLSPPPWIRHLYGWAVYV